MLEGNKENIAKARCASLFRGPSPRYGYEWRSQELGRPEWFPGNGVSADNPKRRGSGNDHAGVGPVHSRGVAG